MLTNMPEVVAEHTELLVQHDQLIDGLLAAAQSVGDRRAAVFVLASAAARLAARLPEANEEFDRNAVFLSGELGWYSHHLLAGSRLH